MATYTTAGKIVDDLLSKVIRTHYPELKDAAVSFDLLMAHAKRNEKSGEPEGHALTAPGGWPACARIKVVGLKDRVAGRADVELLLDGDQWDNWEPERQEAVIASELEYLEIRRNEAGNVKTDDCGRPKLRCRLPDFYVKGFESIIERYREQSVEGAACAALFRRVEQKLFAFMGS